jgi:uncharacterized protein
MEYKTRKIFFIISPLIPIIICQFTAITLGKYLKEWVWAPIIIIYWLILILLIFIYDPSAIKRWLLKPTGHWIWLIISILLGLLPLPLMFIWNLNLLRGATIIVPYILLFVINPWLEEFYWRGVLLDSMNDLASWIGITYSSILFSLNHAAFAWYSTLSRGPSLYINALFLGVIWAIVYRKTKSLRWCIFSHILADMFSMSVPVFLNLYKL